MHTGIDLGVVFGALGHAPQARELGQQHVQSAAVAQHLEHAFGRGLHQPAREFLPYALGNQVAGLASLDHRAHQGHGFGRDAEVGKARREARHAQYAHRVFAKRIGHMAQQLGLQVALAPIGVAERAARGPACGRGHGIDGQVAAREVFLQRDIGRGLHGKAAVAAAALALGARERVFLVGLGVQEDGKVAAHGLVALGDHFFGRGADHDPVAVMDRAAEQMVAHRAADHENLNGTHAPSVAGFGPTPGGSQNADE